MKAMILAAGMGTRLRPLTDRIPKALVEVEGIPMLERVILRLREQGFDRLVVNIHHLGDQIVGFLSARDYGIEIEISDEREELLNTGGGIVKAMPLLFKDDREPVLIHNVDILSNADLGEVMGEESILLVSGRKSNRRLLFDEDMTLRGWHNETTGEFRPESVKEMDGLSAYAFSGIYSLTYESIEEMKKLRGEEAFPVMDYFLDSRREVGLKGYFDSNLHLIDIGKPATLSQASDFIN
ncbi:MAG: NTP transferase domain-containing protein [Muribaculaceae bacterium]|nr:NTP transferase domain-containing protein [Muribaculaceae bacterium]